MNVEEIQYKHFFHIEECRRISRIMKRTLEGKKSCTNVFESMLSKIKKQYFSSQQLKKHHKMLVHSQSQNQTAKKDLKVKETDTDTTTSFDKKVNNDNVEPISEQNVAKSECLYKNKQERLAELISQLDKFYKYCLLKEETSSLGNRNKRREQEQIQ